MILREARQFEPARFFLQPAIDAACIGIYMARCLYPLIDDGSDAESSVPDDDFIAWQAGARDLSGGCDVWHDRDDDMRCDDVAAGA